MSALADKRVLLVGAGGLGSAVGLVLARSGVGQIVVADDDLVSASNLHRQLLYCPADVGRSKAVVACERIEAEAQSTENLTRAVAREIRLDPGVDPESLREFDVVVEGADNFPSKFLVADACAIAGVPLVQGGAVRWAGWALGTLPGRSACLRCVFEDIPAGPDRGCAEAGVVGPVVGVIGALQSALALRLLQGDASAAGALYHYDALAGALRSTRVNRNLACRLCAGEIHDLKADRYLPRECAV
jgi:molybdopterin-synthase adenylyltransferase